MVAPPYVCALRGSTGTLLGSIPMTPHAPLCPAVLEPCELDHPLGDGISMGFLAATAQVALGGSLIGNDHAKRWVTHLSDSIGNKSVVKPIIINCEAVQSRLQWTMG
jgi:hypothetical protein